MREEWITSRKNPLLVQIRRLASSRGARRSAGMFLGDGVKLLEEALKWGAPLETVVYSEGLDGPELPPEVRTIRVPEDVSVISIDDSDLARHSEVPITSLPHPKENLGKKAAETLLQMIAGKKKDLTYEFDTRVVERESVAEHKSL